MANLMLFGVRFGGGPGGCSPGKKGAVQVGVVRVGAVWVGAKISRFFFLSRPSFCFVFQFLRFFVELRWSLRVFIIENVFTTHIL